MRWGGGRKAVFIFHLSFDIFHLDISLQLANLI